MSLPLAKLTCQQCQQRKTRCDKRQPQCSACERAGLQCLAVQRQRLPRGKSGNAKRVDPAVKARIERLENLVVQLQQQIGTSSNDAATQGLAQMSLDRPGPAATVVSEQPQIVPSPQASITSSSSSENNAWSTSFWEQLSGAVDGLREVLDSPEEDEIEAPTSELHAASTTGSPGLLVGFGDKTPMRTPNEHTSDEVRDKLLKVYGDRIDPVFKAVHWPSVQINLRNSTWEERTPAMQALEISICFIAVCAIKETEIAGRAEMLEHYRVAARRSIERAGIMSNRDLAILQALTLYLEGLRVCQRNEEFWLLTAVATRSATSYGLDQLNDLPHTTTFDLQVKKRLFFCIGMIDLQASFDRPCRTLLYSHDFLYPPLDVNDAELDSEEQLEAALALNSVGMSEDMIFTLVICAAMLCQRRLGECIIYPKATNPEGVYEEKMGYLADHEAFVQKLRDRYPNEHKRSHMQRFAIQVAEDIGNSMALFVRRPMQRQTGGFRPPQGDDVDVLAVGTGVLESWVTLKNSPVYAKWMWLVWVPWQALAVTLAELCGPRQGLVVERAWHVVMPAYEMCSALVAKGRSEWLWRPIVTLMRRAKAVREAMHLRASNMQPVQSPAAVAESRSGKADSGREQTLSMAQGTAAYPTDSTDPTSFTRNAAQTHFGALDSLDQNFSLPMQGAMDVNSGSVPPWEQSLDPSLDWRAGMDFDAMAWTNWETFVDDLYKPVGWPT